MVDIVCCIKFLLYCKLYQNSTSKTTYPKIATGDLFAALATGDKKALLFALISSHHRDNRTRELATSRDRGQQCKFKMVA